MWLKMRQIALVANKLAPIVEDMHEVLGLEVGFRDPGVKVFGLENALFPVGNQFIEVVAPIQENTAGGRYLERRKGDGGYMVILQCDDHAPRKRRVAELGIRKALEHDGPEFRNMQLHPRDTGGSFLEIDQQVDWTAEQDPWSPAGKNWKPAVRTHIVRAIAAAEIQSPEPPKLAERWGRILELPVKPDGAGNASIALQNAAIRFVKDADGRGEGLAGIDLVATDRAAALAAAQKHGRIGAGETISICGMRIRLV
jgi:hypothetical protein